MSCTDVKLTRNSSLIGAILERAKTTGNVLTMLSWTTLLHLFEQQVTKPEYRTTCGLSLLDVPSGPAFAYASN